MKSVNIYFIKLIIALLLNSCFTLSAQDLPKGLNIPNRLWNSDKDEVEFYKDSIPVIVPDYFLLGTMRNHYMGHFYGLKENQIDYYEVHEEPFVDYLKNYIQQQFNISISIQKDGNNIATYSKELSEILNNYFDEKGFIEIGLFDSKAKIYSFLLGSYCRYGFKSGENIYGLNKQYYSTLTYFLLEKAGCNKILYQRTKYFIPNSALFYFKPSVMLKMYIDMNGLDSIYCNRMKGKVDDKIKIDELIERVFNSFVE